MTQPAGTVENSSDCNDTNAQVYPGATERCDSIDNDCDSLIDDADASVAALTWYQDADGDGFGDAMATMLACVQPANYSDDPRDCDDGDADINPLAEEVCEAGLVDEDCDTLIDDADTAQKFASYFYADVDGDGAGDITTELLLCSMPTGWVENGDDCDDLRSDVNPYVLETCDAADIDEDCNGVADNADAKADNKTIWYGDVDGDGYGLATAEVERCDPVGSEVSDNTDCDDTEAAAWTGATEVCWSGVDEDCDHIGCALTGTVNLDDVGVKLVPSTDRDQVGYHVCSAGDTDGDGRGDILVSANFWDQPGIGTIRGAVFLVEGPPAGTYDLGGATAMLYGEADRDEAGTALAAGDFDGDGVPDIATAAYKNDAAGTDAGIGYLHYGPVSGTMDLGTADARLLGATAGDQTGFTIGNAGDVDGDGADELLLGAAGYRGVGPLSGVAWLVSAPIGTMSLATTIGLFGTVTQGQAGSSVGSAGDLNGDGFDDVLVGAPYVPSSGISGGVVYIIHGPITASMSLADADTRLLGEVSRDYVGNTVAGGQDVDGDGAPDVLVAGLGQSADSRGLLWLVSAPSAGDVSLAGAAAKLRGESAGDYAGFAADLAGDVDGDGRSEVIVGARYNDATATDAGAAYLLYGPISGTVDLGAADLVLRGGARDDQAGRSVAGAGDVDGDGLADLLVGAYHDNTRGTGAGAAFLLYGSGL